MRSETEFFQVQKSNAKSYEERENCIPDIDLNTLKNCFPNRDTEIQNEDEKHGKHKNYKRNFVFQWMIRFNEMA